MDCDVGVGWQPQAMDAIDRLEKLCAIVSPVKIDCVSAAPVERDRFRTGCWVGYQRGGPRHVEESLDDPLPTVGLGIRYQTTCFAVVDRVVSAGHSSIDLEARNAELVLHELGKLIQVGNEGAPAHSLLARCRQLPEQG